MFRAGAVPPQFNCGVVTPIYKRGERVDTENYRPIAVLHPVLRLYAGLLNKRLLQYTERSGLRAFSQAGFRPRHSVSHQIFVLQHLLDQQRALRRPMFACFLDLKGAYDRVCRPLLWSVLERVGVQGTMLAAIQGLYATSSIAVQVEGNAGKPLPSVRGVRQGCPLSPTLFGLLADGLSRCLEGCAGRAGVPTPSGWVATSLSYADDFCLMADSPSGLQVLIDAASEWCIAVGMQICHHKTACMELSSASSGPHVWQVGGVPIGPIGCVKYLGLRVVAGVGFVSAPEHRLTQTYAAWAVLRARYKNLNCSRGVWLLLHLYRACVLPVSLFGSEVWGVYPLRGPAKKFRDRLATLHLSLLKSIAGVRRTVATPIILAELRMESAPDLWLLNAVRLWNALASGSEFYQSMLGDAWALASRRGSGGWARGLRDSLTRVGLGGLMVAGATPLINVITVRRCLQARDTAMFANLHASPRLAPSEGARRCTYTRWFSRLQQGDSVIEACIPPPHLQSLLRFRMGCHGLPRDVGSRLQIPRADRLCRLCHSGPGDEQHVVFECAALEHVRREYPSLAFTGTMRGFMWQGRVCHLAAFVHQVLGMCAL
jgi:hypothetical protein